MSENVKKHVVKCSIRGNKGTLLRGNCHFMVMNDHFGGPSAIESTELCELVDWHNVLVVHPPAFEVASSKHYIILCSLSSFSYIIIICHLSELKPTSFANFCLQARTLSWTDLSWSFTFLTFKE